MKTTITSLILLGLMSFGFVACDDDDEIYDPVPMAPQAVYSITGDDAVIINWFGPYERDIVEYIIWRSYVEFDNYTEIGRRIADANPNLDLIVYDTGYVDFSADNSQTYFYAVSAVDQAGQISELSAETVFDTPRPEGMVELTDIDIDINSAGFNLYPPSVVPGNSILADIFIDRAGDVFYINTIDYETFIQGMGYTSSFDDIGWAPATGWSATGWAEIVLNHTYVVLTSDGHFAKMRVTAIDYAGGSVTFQWAYQEDQGNQELAPGSENENESVATDSPAGDDKQAVALQ